MVPRPRLQARLAQSLQKRLTVVVASAGFGKTTLVSSWLRQRQEMGNTHVAWLSLDARDQDPLRLLRHLVAACQQIDLNLGKETLALLETPHAQDLELLFAPLINDLADVAAPVLLVLDDYHEIKSKAIHDGFTFLIEHLPSQVHLILTSRTDPPLPLVRWRARCDLVEIRSADLRFTWDEGMHFLNGIMDLGLTEQEINTLVTRTEGWAAALQLAALSLINSEDPVQFIETFSGNHRGIVDYLLEEVLQQQPEETQSFLLQTSILERLSADLCDAVLCTDSGSCQVMLEALERANLFLVPLDDERHWYRYHHLFADLLSHRLQQQSPTLGPRLHRRASQWHADRGLPRSAVHHALAAGDLDTAAQLVERNVEALWKQGAVMTLRQWLESLSLKLMETHPTLLLFHAWTISVTQSATARAMLPRIKALTETEPMERQVRLRALIWVLESHLLRRAGEPAAAVARAQQALSALSSHEEMWRGIALISFGNAAWALGALHTAVDALQQAQELGELSGNFYSMLVAANDLFEIQMEQGHLQATAACLVKIQKQIEAHQLHTMPISGSVAVGLGWLAYEKNQLSEAQWYFEQAIQSAAAATLPDVLMPAYLGLARLHGARANWDAADAALARAEQLAQRDRNDTLMAQTTAMTTWLARRHHRIPDPDALQRLSATVHLGAEAFRSRMVPVALVEALQARGQAMEAAELLHELQHEAEFQGRWGILIELLVQQTVLFYQSGDRENAFTALQRAIILAAPQGYVRTFLDAGDSVVTLLAHGLQQDLWGPQTSYVHSLLACDIAPVTPPQAVVTAPQMEAISPRELDVLRLMAAGQSNQQIAETLFLSLFTVKNHVARILAKLDVENRTGAAARARELELL
jgi:LuxR family maltose regulon positive regulatory protein